MIGGGVALAIAPDFAPPTLGAGYRSGVTDADLDELVRRFVAGDAQALEQVISVYPRSQPAQLAARKLEELGR